MSIIERMQLFDDALDNRIRQACPNASDFAVMSLRVNASRTAACIFGEDAANAIDLDAVIADAKEQFPTLYKDIDVAPTKVNTAEAKDGVQPTEFRGQLADLSEGELAELTTSERMALADEDTAGKAAFERSKVAQQTSPTIERLEAKGIKLSAKTRVHAFTKDNPTFEPKRQPTAGEIARARAAVKQQKAANIAANEAEGERRRNLAVSGGRNPDSALNRLKQANQQG